MPKRITLERLTGVVALSYLVLIPAAAVFAWQRLSQIDSDVSTLWEKAGLDKVDPAPRFPFRRWVE